MKVKFVPQEVEFEIAPGQTLMELAHKNGIPIRSTCNGLPSCAECRVLVVEGDSNVNPPSRKELNLIGTGYYIDQRRLSCQVLCFGDIVVNTAEQLDKAGEGPITKKYLSRVHKDSAADTHSVGGVLIEQDGALLKQIEIDGQQQQQRPQQNRNQNNQQNNRNQGRPQQPRGQPFRPHNQNPLQNHSTQSDMEPTNRQPDSIPPLVSDSPAGGDVQPGGLVDVMAGRSQPAQGQVREGNKDGNRGGRSRGGRNRNRGRR